VGSAERRQRVEQVTKTLREGITQIFDTAMSVDDPAGTNAEWDALRNHYGVAAISDAEREQVRAAQSPTRGAALMELSQTVKSLCTWARRETKRIDIDIIDDPPELRVMHQRLVGLVDRVDDELGSAYRAAVLPARKGMFGNVLIHHDASAPKPKWHKSQTLVFKCKNCGAPKLSKTDTECPFCGRPL
jgi:hypothetical protein